MPLSITGGDLSQYEQHHEKPVFGVSDQVPHKPGCDQVPHKPGCTATENGQRLKILDLGRREIVLSM